VRLFRYQARQGDAHARKGKEIGMRNTECIRDDELRGCLDWFIASTFSATMPRRRDPSQHVGRCCPSGFVPLPVIRSCGVACSAGRSHYDTRRPAILSESSWYVLGVSVPSLSGVPWTTPGALLKVQHFTQINTTPRCHVTTNGDPTGGQGVITISGYVAPCA